LNSVPLFLIQGQDLTYKLNVVENGNFEDGSENKSILHDLERLSNCTKFKIGACGFFVVDRKLVGSVRF
jgi:hypothetical protein